MDEELAEPELAEVTAALAKNAETHDREASFPRDGIETVHAAGLLTATMATEYGGPGAGLSVSAAILRALGKGDPSVALITAMTLFAHALHARERNWPEDIYESVVEESRNQPVLINALRVEPELGSPSRGGLPATTARRTDDGWELSGRKIFSTGAEGLRWMMVFARTDEDPPRTGTFLVRGDAPGITIERTWDHLGLRASRSDDVTFDRTPLPEHAVAELAVPAPPGARLTPFLAWNALGIAALYLGVADAARDWLIGFLAERTPTSLGKPLATLPRFQSAVGEIDAALTSAGEFVASLARSVDEDDEAAIGQAGIAKLTSTRAAIGAVELAVALTGNNGLTRRYPLERHYRDVLCSRVHAPQDDSILLAAGRSALGF
jgi:alkylation response protein AidB-like acyl-CoA dehydrogenase